MDIEAWFSRTWLAESGLYRLDPYPLDSQISRVGTETVQNENGILFLCYMLIAMYQNRLPHPALPIAATIRSLQHADHPGLFNRQPFGSTPVDRMEAQDNNAAIVCLSTLYDLPYTVDMLEYGEHNGYNYNNVDPTTWDIKQQRQGGEVAYYKVCAGRIPAPWEWAWFCGGLTVSTFQQHASNIQLAWMRIFAVDHALTLHTFPQWVLTSYIPVSTAWKVRHMAQLPAVRRSYYKAGHPILQMAQ